MLRGGQYFFPDEWRYQRSVVLASDVLAGNLHRLPADLGVYEDHVGFVPAALVPALAQLSWLRTLHPSALDLATSAFIPALFLSAFSVSVVALVYALARRAGSPPEGALLAAGFAACANSLFYYARHLVPYDLALALGLAALLVALDPATRPRTSLLCGLLAGAAMFCWYGTWPLVGIVLAFHAFPRKGEPCRAPFSRLAIAGATTALPFLVMQALSVGFGREPFFRRVAVFSSRVRMGELSEGWSHPIAYLWHSEHGLALLWAAALVYGIWLALRRRALPAAGVWLAAAIGGYGLLVLGSVGLRRFVVYGRSTRLLTPFLCLVAASAVYDWGLRLSAPHRRSLLALVVVAVALQAGLGFREPFSQRFPLDLEESARTFHGDLTRATTLKRPQRSLYERYLPPATTRRPAARDLVLVNASFFYPVVGTRPAPNGAILVARRHPFAFLPYQYEGHAPGERDLLRKADLRMMVVDTARAAPPSSHAP